MSVRPIPSFEVACDEPGCGVTTGELGEYTGWGDEGAALDDWRECDGIALSDGRTFCGRHASAHICDECGEFEDECECESVTAPRGVER